MELLLGSIIAMLCLNSNLLSVTPPGPKTRNDTSEQLFVAAQFCIGCTVAQTEKELTSTTIAQGQILCVCVCVCVCV